MVVLTIEDTSIGDGDPILELANVEVAIVEATAGAKAIARVLAATSASCISRAISRAIFSLSHCMSSGPGR
jgi:hypothetical protein